MATPAETEAAAPPPPCPSCPPAASAAAPLRSVVGGYDSPLQAMREGPREKLLYIPCVLHRHGRRTKARRTARSAGAGGDGAGGDGKDEEIRSEPRSNPHPDYLATVDLDESSATFSQVVHRLPMPRAGDELHHMGWNACSSCRDRRGEGGEGGGGAGTGGGAAAASATATTRAHHGTHAFLVIPGVVSGDIHFVDVSGERARRPELRKTLPGEELRRRVGVALPHTSHCGPDSIILSFMGSRVEKKKTEKEKKEGEGEGEGEDKERNDDDDDGDDDDGDDDDDGFEFSADGNGFVELDPTTFEIKGRWERADAASDPRRRGAFGYDFWYQPHPSVDALVSSEWGDPRAFLRGFDPTSLSSPGAAREWGSRLYFWSFSRRELLQAVDLGPGTIPLEVRFLHRPDAAEGYVGCALSSEMVRFFRKGGGEGGGGGGEGGGGGGGEGGGGGGGEGTWTTSTTISIPAVDVVGWALPSLPALITDFVLSLDDRYLFLACWLHGEVRQYDIATDPERPRLVSRLEGIGGLLHSENRGGVRRADGAPQPPPVSVKGRRVRGGAQMIQLSLDGKRLYVSTSLFSSWDEQFYGDELAEEGGQLLRILVGDGDEGMRVDESFLVDFGDEPWGAALPHEMRFPGGDCTSDIWVK